MANRKGSRKVPMSITVDYLTKRLCEDSGENISGMVNNFLLNCLKRDRENLDKETLRLEKEKLQKDMENISQRITNSIISCNSRTRTRDHNIFSLLPS